MRRSSTSTSLNAVVLQLTGAVWQRLGIGLWWETYPRPGFDPARGVEVTAVRRRVKVERDLPMKDAYRTLIEELATTPASGTDGSHRR